MTIDELMEHLKELKAHGLPGFTIVQAFDADSMAYEEVTGTVYEPDTAKALQLQTDDIS